MHTPTINTARVPGLDRLTTPRANRFIVTLYGDVVEPRGGALWMGSLIFACAQQGISESLVRTAVSRLVASGHLEGERVGRKSFYRLSKEARDEFSQAARLFYEPLVESAQWWIALDQTTAPSSRWAQIGPRAYIASQVVDEPTPEGVVFCASAVPTLHVEQKLANAPLAAIVAQLWPIEKVADLYTQFVELFLPLQHYLNADGQLQPEQALAARLLLVHRYRQIVLQDPRLPQHALPAHWVGHIASCLFADIYLRLGDSADSFIAEHFVSIKGSLPKSTQSVRTRMINLKRVATR